MSVATDCGDPPAGADQSRGLRQAILEVEPPKGLPCRIAYLLPEGVDLDYYDPRTLEFARSRQLAPPPWPFVEGVSPSTADWRAAGFQVLDFR